VGLRPLMVFCGALFDMHPRYQHFKTLMMDFFRGQTVESMEIDGLQHVVCLSVGEQQSLDPMKEDLPPISFRVYIIRSKKVVGSKVPKIELEEMGPRMDLKFGRWRETNEEMMSMALKKPKETVVQPFTFATNFQVKTKKNVEIDTIGDTLGRIHVGIQDLGKLQTRKMRGLKRRAGDDDEESSKRQKIPSKQTLALEE
jgi:ribosome production factor 2